MTTVQDVLKEYNKFINIETPIHYIPFSLPSLNIALTIPGLRSGRLYEIIGKESSGKTTLSLDLIKNAQQLGYQCAYVDFERTFDDVYARKLGVDTDSLIIVKADTTETGFDITEALIKSGVKLVIIDSIPAAVPSSEAEKEYSDNEKMASSATIVTRFCRRIVPILDNNGAIIVALNQYRANFSQMSRKETKYYGPFLLHHTASIIIGLVRISKEKERVAVKATTEKNKLGVEQQFTEFYLEYGEGIDIAEDVIECAVQRGLVEKNGKWYYYGNIKANGMEQAKEKFPIDVLQKELSNVE